MKWIRWDQVAKPGFYWTHDSEGFSIIEIREHAGKLEADGIGWPEYMQGWPLEQHCKGFMFWGPLDLPVGPRKA